MQTVGVLSPVNIYKKGAARIDRKEGLTMQRWKQRRKKTHAGRRCCMRWEGYMYETEYRGRARERERKWTGTARQTNEKMVLWLVHVTTIGPDVDATMFCPDVDVTMFDPDVVVTTIGPDVDVTLTGPGVVRCGWYRVWEVHSVYLTLGIGSTVFNQHMIMGGVVFTGHKNIVFNQHMREVEKHAVFVHQGRRQHCVQPTHERRRCCIY